jgi:hypothetical protein
MNRREFDALALRATDDVFAFAQFAQQSEDAFAGSTDAVGLERYQRA